MEENTQYLNGILLKEFSKTRNPIVKVKIEGYRNLIKISKEKNYPS